MWGQSVLLPVDLGLTTEAGSSRVERSGAGGTEFRSWCLEKRLNRLVMKEVKPRGNLVHLPRRCVAGEGVALCRRVAFSFRRAGRLVDRRRWGLGEKDSWPNRRRATPSSRASR